ncbi:MAG: alpha/beta-type small acid-soluble spore protein [Alicyclobacillus sp.]|nr:alpha/beta-type small acid-soluble spore protein [Alicyclobacillus sp.]
MAGPPRGAAGGNDKDAAKARVAARVGVPYAAGRTDHGEMTARQAGKLGGEIGGAMVQRLVEIARQELSKQPPLVSPLQVRQLLGRGGRSAPRP